MRCAVPGVIGMSNVVACEETAGRYLTYLPKYVLSDDPLLKRSDEELRSIFFDGLYLMFPNLRADDIEAVHINRAVKVQPLQVLNYSSLVPQVTTEHQDFFVLNTSQFVCGTLNNNEVIRAVDEFLEKYSPSIEHRGNSLEADSSRIGSRANLDSKKAFQPQLSAASRE